MADEIQNKQENNEAAAADSTPVENKTEAAAEVKAPKAEKTAEKKVKNTMASIEKTILEEKNNFGKFPEFAVGDTIKVYVKIIEGDKQRIQPYEGVVLAMKHGGPQESFTVRRISASVAIERVFPMHSPYLQKIELVRKGRVRRAKLYYLRGRFGRSAVVTEKV
jgi:large subunit ribosomal protein L19